jgi:exodeoxyribonuclease-1
VPSIHDTLDIPFEQLEERAIKIRNNTQLQTRISELLTNNQIQYPPPKFVEQAVYTGFPSREDELWMERFHSTPWEERHKLIEGFEDSRYRELAERLICSNSVDGISDHSLQKYNSFLTQRFSEKGPWLNLDRTLTKIGEMLEAEDDQENKEVLHELQKKLKKITF